MPVTVSSSLGVGSLLSSSSPSSASSMRLSGGLESSLILNRAAKSASGIATGCTGYTPGSADTAVLALELKRHERKRHLMRLRYNPGAAEKEEEKEVEAEVKRRSEARERLRRTGSDKENANGVRYMGCLHYKVNDTLTLHWMEKVIYAAKNN